MITSQSDFFWDGIRALSALVARVRWVLYTRSGRRRRLGQLAFVGPALGRRHVTKVRASLRFASHASESRPLMVLTRQAIA